MMRTGSRLMAFAAGLSGMDKQAAGTFDLPLDLDPGEWQEPTYLEQLKGSPGAGLASKEQAAQAVAEALARVEASKPEPSWREPGVNPRGRFSLPLELDAPDTDDPAYLAQLAGSTGKSQAMQAVKDALVGKSTESAVPAEAKPRLPKATATAPSDGMAQHLLAMLSSKQGIAGSALAGGMGTAMLLRPRKPREGDPKDKARHLAAQRRRMLAATLMAALSGTAAWQAPEIAKGIGQARGRLQA
jgi:hypothetical protein